MATGQCRSAISLDDVAQKTTLARSAHQNNSERTSKPLEEQCDEFVSLVSVRFQGVKTIDVIERNRLPKNSVAFEPGDLEVDFVCVFPTLLRTIFPFFKGGEANSVRVRHFFWLFCLVWYQGGLVHRSTCTQVRGRVHRYTGALVYKYINTLVYRYSGTPLPRDTNTRVQVHLHTGTPIHRYTAIWIHRYNDTPVH